ncbi:type III effector, partial [Escherichia coli]
MHRATTKKSAAIPNALMAARYQAGNCNEMADVSYTLLAQKRINAPVLLLDDNDWDHKYVLIGDPRDQIWGEKNTVVVDPWVRYPSATTLDQSI